MTLLAVRLLDLGTLVSMGLLELTLAAFAFLIFRGLVKGDPGYVPPAVEAEPPGPTAPTTSDAPSTGEAEQLAA